MTGPRRRAGGLAAWWASTAPTSWLTDRQVLEHRAIPDALWQQTLADWPFLTWRPPAAQARLRALATLFLARKQFTPVGELALTDAMAVAMAAQACLPVLQQGLGPYQRFVGIVVHANQVIAPRTVVDEDTGVVHHYEEILAGETMPDGPITLSWQDVVQGGHADEVYNVVIHEFVHAIDMQTGDADGTPPLPPGLSKAHWQDTLWQAFDQLNHAQVHGDELWLDPYALSHGLVEFFPVVAEAFFVAPQKLQAAHPEVYSLLSRYFGDDPATWAASST